MKTLGLSRWALAIGAASALLAGCGGSQPPIGAPGAMPQSRPILTHGERGGSWMLPEAKNQDLLYVAGWGRHTGHVDVFSYHSGEFVGTLGGFKQPNGECVDAAGDVFVTDKHASDIVEYAHGGTTPLVTLSDKGYIPAGCSVDRTTGNLAVANVCSGSFGCSSSTSARGNVLIFRKARGTPKVYVNRHISEYFYCAYDGKGNLFVDGYQSGYFAFAGLPKGRTRLKAIALNQYFELGGGVAWDGKNVAVAAMGGTTVYRFAITGSKGTEIGATPLVGSRGVGAFWIQNGDVIGPNFRQGSVRFWKYPGGGLIRKIRRRAFEPYAVTVSPGTQ